MNKRGFTLIELLAVIAILGVILTIAGVSISGVLNKSKENSMDIQIDMIKDAARAYVTKNLSEYKDEGTYNITVKTLIDEGYIDEVKDDSNNTIEGSINVTKSGNRYNYDDVNITYNGKEIQNGIIMSDATVTNFSYTGTYKTYTAPKDSRCLLEVWGAQGGGASSSSNYSYLGGKGGYSKGVISMTEGTKLYIYVGGKGKFGSASTTVAGGYNGGGSCPVKSTGTYNRGSGGGATDIRISTSLNGRIIVAGGGGGSGYAYSTSYVTLPGYGGGLVGGNAGDSTDGTRTGGKGGTQQSGGEAGKYSSSNGGTAGTFGNGGTAGYQSTNNFTGGAGGGGWYGGGGSGDGGPSGGGGSGYVLTYSSYKPSGYNPDPKYYLTGATTVAGNTTFPSPNGGNETGHSGDGYARITCN